MRNFFCHSLVMLAFILTACTEVTAIYDNPEQEAITLNAVTGIATKSAVTGTVFPTDRSIWLAAYYNAPAPHIDKSTNYFPETEFRYKTNTDPNDPKNEWECFSDTRFWPFDGSLKMLAYSTTNKNAYSVTWPTAANTKYTDYVEITINNVDVEDDLLCAYSDAVTKSNKALTFTHAKAWVFWTARSNFEGKKVTTGEAANRKNEGITVKSVTLKNVSYKAKVRAQYANSALGYSWSDYDAVADMAAPGMESPKFLSKTIATGETWQDTTHLGYGILVPAGQRIAKDQAVFTIEYTLHNGFKDAEKTQVNDIELAYTYSLPNELLLEPGKKYHFDIQYTLQKITVTATVTDWTVVAQSPVSL